MPKRDIVVIGASAGGVEALRTLVRSLPEGFEAAVFVVMHFFPRSRSLLPEILDAAGPLRAAHAIDGERIEKGRIYVAAPDRHLLIERDHVHLGLGPKEQHQRPSINVTFRSAAMAHGPRVIGVVLTGQLDDGTAGLWDVKRHGGLAIVQHPEEAAFPSMPLSALRSVEADYTLPLVEIGPTLARVSKEELSSPAKGMAGALMEPEITDLTCPDCKGTIWRERRGNLVEYRCRIGHKFSPCSFLAEHFAAQEKLLWSSVVALEEGASLAQALIEEVDPGLRESLEAEARQRLQQAKTLRQLLLEQKTFSLE